MNERIDPNQPDVEPLLFPLPPRVQQRSKPRTLLKWVLALLLIAAIVGAGAWLYFSTQPTTPPTSGRGRFGGGLAPQTIVDAAVTKGDIPIYIDGLGTVTSLATATVRTQISGTLEQIGFQEGQTVKAGDFLAQIDSRPYEASLAQAQGQLAKDTTLLAGAQADLDRYQTLAKQNSIAPQQVEDQKFLVTQDTAATAVDRAQIEAAQLNITYCHIVAPIGGRVGLRQVDQGNYAQPSDANGIVIIAQIQPISVIFSVPEDDLPQIADRMKGGATLPVTVFDRSNTKQLGVGMLTTTDNEIDTTTGTVKLRASFSNDDSALFPDQFVNARVLVDTLSGVPVVPNAAIQLGATGSFVYVVNDDSTVSVRNVVTGPADAGHTAITSGLTVGEKVVTDGVDQLRDGSKVVEATPVATEANTATTTHRHGRPAGTAPSGAGPAADQGAGANGTPGQRRHRRADATASASDASPANAAPSPN